MIFFFVFYFIVFFLFPDACQLLENHRIVGTLVGSLPRYPKQDVQLGLPLQLMQEEATLLSHRGQSKLHFSRFLTRLHQVEPGHC